MMKINKIFFGLLLLGLQSHLFSMNARCAGPFRRYAAPAVGACIAAIASQRAGVSSDAAVESGMMKKNKWKPVMKAHPRDAKLLASSSKNLSLLDKNDKAMHMIQRAADVLNMSEVPIVYKGQTKQYVLACAARSSIVLDLNKINFHLDLDENCLKQVILHELSHIKLRHMSADDVYIDLLDKQVQLYNEAMQKVIKLYFELTVTHCVNVLMPDEAMGFLDLFSISPFMERQQPFFDEKKYVVGIKDIVKDLKKDLKKIDQEALVSCGRNMGEDHESVDISISAEFRKALTRVYGVADTGEIVDKLDSKSDAVIMPLLESCSMPEEDVNIIRFGLLLMKGIVGLSIKRQIGEQKIIWLLKTDRIADEFEADALSYLSMGCYACVNEIKESMKKSTILAGYLDGEAIDDIVAYLKERDCLCDDHKKSVVTTLAAQADSASNLDIEGA